MHKAASMENVRDIKSKSHGQMSRPVAKSSSERDLRSAGANKFSDKSTTVSKPRRKPGRTNSLSDITATSVNSAEGGEMGKQRYSADLSSSTKTNADLSKTNGSLSHWPKTSTPAPSRDDSSPDGCSSPDEDSDTHLSSRELTPDNSHDVHLNDLLTSPSAPDISTASVDKAFIGTPTTNLLPPQTTYQRKSLPSLFPAVQ